MTTTRERSAEMDAMSEDDKEADLLKNIAEHGAICLTKRSQVAFWGAAVDRLVEAGKVKVEDTGNDLEQYTCLQVTAVEDA